MTTLSRLFTFGSRDESLFLYGNFVSNLGNGIQIIAAAYVILVRTNSVLSVGVLFIFAALPQAILSVVSGRRADQGHSKAICIASDLIRAACVAAIPVSLATGRGVTEVLYASTFVVSLFDAVFAPAGSSWIQRILARAEYARFSSRFEISTQTGLLISSAVGGFAVDWFSAEAVFAFNAVTFLVSAAFLSFVRPAGPAPAAGPQDAGQGPALAVAADKVPWARTLPAALLFAQGKVIPTVMNTLLIVLVVTTLRKGIGALGLVDAIAGVAFTMGALLFTRANRRISITAILILGYLLTAGLIFPQPLFGIVGLGIAFGAACFTFGLGRVAVRATLMNETDERYAGRIFGAANGIGFILGAACTLLVSWIVEATSVTVGYACVGGYLLLITVIAGLPLARQARRASMAGLQTVPAEVEDAITP
jgi:hypothetical protein